MKKTFRIFAVMLSLMIAVCTSPPLQNAQATSTSDLTFKSNYAGGWIVTDCAESATGNLVIPDSYNGKPVVSIGNSAFENCTGLTTISIPDTVTSIANYSFAYCSNLTAIRIGRNVTTIGANAFRDCSNLTSIIIPDSVNYIDNQAFEGCKKLTSITIPASVTTLGSEVFRDCTGLTSVTLSNGIVNLGVAAFRGCSGLTSITIPDSITNLDDSLFYLCSNLTSIIVPNSVTRIGYRAFGECKSLTNVIYCGTQQQWDTVEKGSSNDPLINATLQFHDYWGSVCRNCGHDSSVPAQSATLTVTTSGDTYYRGDTVTVSVSTSPAEHCVAGGFLFTYDTNIFEYVSGESLLSGFSAAGVSNEAGRVAGYFMNGNATVQGDIFQITLKVKDDAAFGSYTISGQPSLNTADGTVSCSADGAAVTVVCKHRHEQGVCVVCGHIAEYTVRFIDWDGTVLSSNTYHWGDKVAVPADPTRAADDIYTYTFSGWDAEVVTCAGDTTYTATYALAFRYAMGDVNGDDSVNYNDAVYLLLHTLFGGKTYPLKGASADINGNGTVDQNDAVYLLLHTLFGESFYPLSVPGSQEN